MAKTRSTPIAPADERFDERETRRQLEERLQRVSEELRRLSARMRDENVAAPLPEDDGGDGSQIDVHLLEMATETLRHIHRAIGRLDRGQYGWCTRCHHRIGAARLRALPFAVRCRACESTREHEMRTAATLARSPLSRVEVTRDTNGG